MSKDVRLIAFYLPQFHPIPENDMWWGKGFTEWTNVAKAKPLFKGHYQPHLPADLGFYDLRVPEVRVAQAKLAKEYGIEGFCYYHYWFGNGKRLLEKPFLDVLNSGNPDFPFCLAWANDSWTGIWHGAPDNLLIEQKYLGPQDYEDHFYTVLDAFRDHRYMTVHGKKIFLIYDPRNLPDAIAFTEQWRKLAQKEGLPGIHFIAHSIKEKPERFGCDACVDNAPFVSTPASFWYRLFLHLWKRIFNRDLPKIRSYSRFVQNLKALTLGPKEYPLVIPNWDNTPRSHKNGFVLFGSNPNIFKISLKDAIRKLTSISDSDNRIIFIKAWNEWAEGNHLEPDMLYGHGYLKALKESLDEAY